MRTQKEKTAPYAPKKKRNVRKKKRKVRKQKRGQSAPHMNKKGKENGAPQMLGATAILNYNLASRALRENELKCT